MKTCKKCNLTYEDDKKFCKECGDPLTSIRKIGPKSIALLIGGIILFIVIIFVIIAFLSPKSFGM